MSERGSILSVPLAAVAEHLLPGLAVDILHAEIDTHGGFLRLRVHGAGLPDGETVVAYTRGLQGRRWCVAGGEVASGGGG